MQEATKAELVRRSHRIIYEFMYILFLHASNSRQFYASYIHYHVTHNYCYCISRGWIALEINYLFSFYQIISDSDVIESPYNPIYGRLPIPTRGFIPNQPRTMYIGEWD